MSVFSVPGHTFIIAEAGINHNGEMSLARALIDAAVEAGCDAVKFQKRTPRLSLKPELWDIPRDTPWGQRMTYLEYRERIELSSENYLDLMDYAKGRILLSASPWDCNAADTVFNLGVMWIKLASASITDLELVKRVGSFNLPIIMSTGMSGKVQISEAIMALRDSSTKEANGHNGYKFPTELGLLVCTSAYPAAVKDLNLRRIQRLSWLYPHATVGYSGHESGLWTTLSAVALGAKIVERHLTLDRSMPGTDQAASVEPKGMRRLVQEIRNLEVAMGSSEIGPLECEKPTIARLR